MDRLPGPTSTNDLDAQNFTTTRRDNLVPDTTVDINQEIPSCEDSYYRCIISFWRISVGWIGLIALICGIGSFGVQGLGSLSGLPDDVKSKFGVAGIILTGIGVACGLVRQFAEKDILDRTQTLEKLIIQYNKFHPQSQVNQSSPRPNISNPAIPKFLGMKNI